MLCSNDFKVLKQIKSEKKKQRARHLTLPAPRGQNIVQLSVTLRPTGVKSHSVTENREQHHQVNCGLSDITPHMVNRDRPKVKVLIVTNSVSVLMDVMVLQRNPSRLHD